MANLISLDHFDIGDRQYHIYLLRESTLAREPHYHNYFQLLYTDSGQVRHTSSIHSITLNRGDAFLIPPGFVHQLRFLNPSTQVYSLSFTADLFHSGFSQSNIYSFLTRLQQHSRNSEDVHLRIELAEPQRLTLSSLMDCLIREQAMSNAESFSAAPSLISASLCILAQNYQNQSMHSVQPSLHRYKLSIANCIQYVDAHYSEPVSVPLLSKKFAVSRSTLYELFPQYAGLHFKQYLRNKRILAAESLIRTRPDLSFGEISATVGYTEASTFYRNFKEVVGVSPSRYKAGYFAGESK